MLMAWRLWRNWLKDQDFLSVSAFLCLHLKTKCVKPKGLCAQSRSAKIWGCQLVLGLIKCFMATVLVKGFNKVFSSKVTDITAQRLTQLTDSGFSLWLFLRESRSFFTDSTILYCHVSAVKQSRDTKQWPWRGHFIFLPAAVGVGEMSCVQFATTSPFKPNPTHRTFNSPYSLWVQLLYNQCCISECQQLFLSLAFMSPMCAYFILIKTKSFDLTNLLLMK